MESDVIKLEDNICPICLYIFIEPVTMPCEHELCLDCFKKNVEEANFCCPLCRIRISTWARRATRNKTLVNHVRWEQIQKAFPDRIKKRLEGDEAESDDEEMKALNVSIKLSEPGEIRNEYKEQMKKLREQRAAERKEELAASERLIFKLQEEEERKRQELEKIQREDEELAREISQADQEVRTRSTSSVTDRTETDSTSMESFLDKIRQENNPSKSPYPYPCLSPIPSGGGKLCVDRDKAQVLEDKYKRRTIRKDKNLITTQDVANLEESFRQNRSRGASNLDGIKIDCLQRGSASSRILKVTNVLSTATLNNEEILEQMAHDIDVDINILHNNPDDDDDSDDGIIIIPTPSPQPIKSLENFEKCNSSSTAVDNPDPENQTRSSSSQSNQSNDSITVELSHFRPIRSCPLTPPRKLASGKVMEPQLIRTTPRNFRNSFSSPTETSLSDIDAGSPIMQRRLSELAEERKDQVAKNSKSTSTASKTTSNENRNPKDNKHKPLPNIHFSRVERRSVEFRDISNSPKQNRNFNFPLVDIECTSKKQLLLPLEPDLTENDLSLSNPLFDIKIIEPNSGGDNVMNKRKVVSKTGKNKLSRSRNVSGSRVRYSAEGLQVSSPQPSIAKWMKQGEELDRCVNKLNMTTSVLLNGRDEVDGFRISKKNSRYFDIDVETASVGNSSNCDLSQNENQTSPLRSKRSRRPFKSNDFVYNDSANTITQSPGGKLVNRTSKCSTIGSNTNDSSRDGFCSDGGSESSDDFLYVSPKKRKKDSSASFDGISDITPPKKKKVTETKPLRVKPMLKTSSRKQLKKTTSNTKQKYSKTMHDYFVTNDASDKTRSNKRGKQELGLVEEDFMEFETDQEQKDRLYAKELQKQFEMEDKFHLNALRFKGSEGEYSFRNNRKRTQVIDA